MSTPAFVVRVLPLYVLALVLTGVGAIPIGERLPSDRLVLLAILALLEFAALMTFRRVRTWSTVLLMVFGLTAGALVRLMLPGIRLQWPWALVASLGIPLFGIPLGWTAGDRLRWMGWLVWAAAWAYVLGWLAWQLLVHSLPARVPWGMAGLTIFSALTLTWSAALPGREASEPEISTASELYIIGLNLGIAALLASGG
ncbi:MAG: hypothetical protein MUO35_06860 [Anaerolineales bacterium]|nr:hypothetical protein [Anaerolineales bacterium]